MREQLIKLVEIIPIEVIVRNIATGSLTKVRVTDGQFWKTINRVFYKKDNLVVPYVKNIFLF